MAALSGRNFLAPFQNKLQLGAIVILATLIALFRLSGGEVTTQTPNQRLRTTQTQSDRAPARAMMRDEDPFADILKEAPEPPKPVGPATPNNLSDVRKALGLE